MKKPLYQKIGKIACVCVLSVFFLQSSTKANSSGDTAPSNVNALIVYSTDTGKEKVISKSIKIIKEYNAVNSLYVTMNTEDLSELKNDKQIASIEFDKPLKKIGTNLPLIFPYEKEAWNYKMVNAQVASSRGITGRGVNVAVLDTGIAHNSELQISGGYSTFDTAYDTDVNGHGTHVAGIIASKNNNWATIGVAPDVNLYSVKIMDDRGDGNLTRLIEGINWSVENKMDILNLSVSFAFGSSALSTAVNSAYDAGITIVAGAGNNSGEIRLPANYSNVIGVSAIDETKTLAEFSSRGSGVDVTAPGVDIISTYKDVFSWGSGTSMATPHVTGLLALLKQENPSFDNKRLETELYRHTEDLGEVGKDEQYGHGLINYTSFNSRADEDERKFTLVERAEEEELKREIRLREEEREQLAKEREKAEAQIIADKKESDAYMKQLEKEEKAEKLKAEKAKKLKAEKLKAQKAKKLKAEKLKAEKAKKLKAEKEKKLKAQKAKKLKEEKAKKSKKTK